MAASVTMRANISELDAMLNDLNEGKYNKGMHSGHTLQPNDYFSDFEENTSYSALPTNYSAHDGKTNSSSSLNSLYRNLRLYLRVYSYNYKSQIFFV